MRVRLELNQLKINRPKERWKIYFVIVAEHPTEADKMVLTTIPTEPIKMTPNQNNVVYFDDSGQGSEGLLLLKCEMPQNEELNVHCYVRHSRASIRTAGEILRDIQHEIGVDALGTISNIIGTTNPWLVITKAALPVIGRLLAKVPDRDLGFISMFERFGEEFKENGEIDRQKTGAYSTIVYTWSIDN
jgi:hypothetical protein